MYIMFEQNFATLIEKVKDKSGMILSDTMMFRIKPFLQSIPAQNLMSPATVDEVIKQVLVHETFFFRHESSFDFIEKHVKNSPKNEYRIWSAACSTGQEPYSLAMLFKKKFPEKNVEIIATDLCEVTLAKAAAGKFSDYEVARGLPLEYKKTFFDKDNCISSEIKRMVTFKKNNLLDLQNWSFGSVDIVFLRNVLIYFDNETKVKILNHVKTVLNKDGLLVLGGTETPLFIDSSWESLGDSVYKL